MEMKRIKDSLKTFSIILCRFVLPFFTIYLFLIMPGFTERPLVADSSLADGTIRLLLTIFFCSNYWQLPILFESNSKRWLGISSFVLNNSTLLKGYYLFMTVGYGLFIAWFTLYAFSTFLPVFGDYRLLFAIINGLIFIVFFVLRYKAFMELVESQKT